MGYLLVKCEYSVEFLLGVIVGAEPARNRESLAAGILVQAEEQNPAWWALVFCSRKWLVGAEGLIQHLSAGCTAFGCLSQHTAKG
jgi:hypothetical protein